MFKKETPHKGRVLVSEPSLQDFYFSKSVVLLVDHNEKEGTVGLILNKPIYLKLNEVVKEFPDIDFPLYLGGPVHPERLFYVHTLGDKIPGSIQILKDVFWGGEIEKIIELIGLNLIQPSQLKFFIGYSGWDAGQLNREMGEKSWIVTQGSRECVMATKPEELWGNILKTLGNEYAIWANFPADIRLN